MAFRYTRPPITQGALSFVVLSVVIGLMQMPSVGMIWASYLENTSILFQFVGMNFILHGLIYWGMTFIFGIVDRTDKPYFIAKHRIQNKCFKRPPAQKVARVLLWNQLFWTPILLFIVLRWLVYWDWSPSTEFPTPASILIKLSLMSVLSAIYFYASHRFLHRPWWMKRVHKLHHEYRTTGAIAAEYTHWFEFIFGNFGTLSIGVMLCFPSLPTVYLFTILGTMTFVGHHTGYALPWMSWAVHHDWHHYRYKEAFGTFGLVDRLLKTDKEFRTLKHGQDKV